MRPLPIPAHVLRRAARGRRIDSILALSSIQPIGRLSELQGCHSIPRGHSIRPLNRPCTLINTPGVQGSLNSQRPGRQQGYKSPWTSTCNCNSCNHPDNSNRNNHPPSPREPPSTQRTVDPSQIASRNRKSHRIAKHIASATKSSAK
ncbi:hypothetical protein BO71DRAFT_435512 [Aspergillus ellipticus CBS 707.79]|uniref:Uncharacterized protein n=1 Tax=Aspergillus ellipticus CBS 707.79 TaxID=1448320 RepID=A0A319DCC4_9EURO|nr:hypothetical protein BO71DRAFT_435512 [Aspergillus ellipticus CBS 707.79]